MSKTLRLLAAGLVVAAAAVLVATARAGALDGTGENATSITAPCNWSGGPPPISSCTVTSPQVTADCHPDATSTISFTATGGLAGGGSFSETVTATMGPQTGPAAPAFQPFAFSGAQVGSIGLPTGALQSFDASFTFTRADGSTVTGTKTLIADPSNTGVCLDLAGQTAPSPVFGGGPMTGFFYLLNAQALAYDATITDAGGATSSDSGVGEAYLMNSYGTYDSGWQYAATSTGSYIAGFGNRTTSAPTPAGTSVAVSPTPGVQLTFGDVTGDGTTSATGLDSVPTLPSGFQVGDPPYYYEISTTATFSGSVQVCVPYGAAPAGTTPTLLHYVGGTWVDVTTAVDPLTQTVCGSVTSFSPFAAVFAPPKAPTSKDACKNGGWQQFTNPAFKNQGDCVSFVATGGRNG